MALATSALPAIPAVLDLIGTAVFALTGALLAARLRQTFVTMSFFALIIGVGGGKVRDLLIGAPVFWVRDPWVAPVCLAVALCAVGAWLGLPRDLAWPLAALAGFSLRGYAIATGLALPALSSRNKFVKFFR